MTTHRRKHPTEKEGAFYHMKAMSSNGRMSEHRKDHQLEIFGHTIKWLSNWEGCSDFQISKALKLVTKKGDGRKIPKRRAPLRNALYGRNAFTTKGISGLNSKLIEYARKHHPQAF